MTPPMTLELTKRLKDARWDQTKHDGGFYNRHDKHVRLMDFPDYGWFDDLIACPSLEQLLEALGDVWTLYGYVTPSGVQVYDCYPESLALHGHQWHTPSEAVAEAWMSIQGLGDPVV